MSIRHNVSWALKEKEDLNSLTTLQTSHSVMSLLRRVTSILLAKVQGEKGNWEATDQEGKSWHATLLLAHYAPPTAFLPPFLPLPTQFHPLLPAFCSPPPRFCLPCHLICLVGLLGLTDFGWHGWEGSGLPASTPTVCCSAIVLFMAALHTKKCAFLWLLGPNGLGCESRKRNCGACKCVHACVCVGAHMCFCSTLGQLWLPESESMWRRDIHTIQANLNCARNFSMGSHIQDTCTVNAKIAQWKL